MKRLFITAVIASGVFITAMAQSQKDVVMPVIPVDSITKKITYKEKVEEPGIKDSLFNRAVHWAGGYFKSSQSVLKTMDKTNGLIKGNHKFKISNQPDKDGLKTDAGFIIYYFTIELKDNKYRYTITDLKLEAVSLVPMERWLDKTDPKYVPGKETYLIQIDEKMKEFIKSLKKGMKEVKKVKDDW